MRGYSNGRGKLRASFSGFDNLLPGILITLLSRRTRNTMDPKQDDSEAITVLRHAVGWMARSGMGGLSLVSKALHQETEGSDVLRPCSLALHGPKLRLFDRTRCVLPKAFLRDLEREGELTEMMDLVKTALQHSLLSSLVVSQHHFKDIRTLVLELDPVPSIASLNLQKVDFSDIPASEFHMFVLSLDGLRSLELDNECTSLTREYLTGKFLQECLAKRLINLHIDEKPADAEHYDLTEDEIVEFITIDVDKDGPYDERYLKADGICVSKGFFKRLIQLVRNDRGKVARFCLELSPVDIDQQDIGEYIWDCEDAYNGSGAVVEFRLRLVPIFFRFRLQTKSVFVSNESYDYYNSDDSSECWASGYNSDYYPSD